MAAYIVRRVLFMIPTLFGIMVLNFVIIHVAPGGPVEQLLAEIGEADIGSGVDVTARISGTGGGETVGGVGGDVTSRYRGARGLDPEFVREIERMYGFDRPPAERFLTMMWNYLRFDFGESYFRDRSVVLLVVDKMDVSISLGLWTTLLVYLVAIPLGIAKAVRDGTPFDVWTSAAIIVGYAVPGFLFAILLVVLFAGGSFLDWFPLRGLTSQNWEELDWLERIVDYFWHLALPILALVIGAFAGLTMLTKNSFLDELGKLYVTAARARGASEHRVRYGHVFRNAMLIVVAGFPSAFVGILFTGALLIEVIFSLDGLGLLGFEAVLRRDYPVIFGTLYMFSLLGLVLRLVGDLMYVAIDPRIDFESRET